MFLAATRPSTTYLPSHPLSGVRNTFDFSYISISARFRLLLLVPQLFLSQLLAILAFVYDIFYYR